MHPLSPKPAVKERSLANGHNDVMRQEIQAVMTSPTSAGLHVHVRKTFRYHISVSQIKPSRKYPSNNRSAQWSSPISLLPPTWRRTWQGVGLEVLSCPLLESCVFVSCKRTGKAVRLSPVTQEAEAFAFTSGSGPIGGRDPSWVQCHSTCTYCVSDYRLLCPFCLCFPKGRS